MGAAAPSPGLKWASEQSRAQAEGSAFLQISFTLDDKKWKLKFSTPSCCKTVKPCVWWTGGGVTCTGRPRCALTPSDHPPGSSPLSAEWKRKWRFPSPHPQRALLLLAFPAPALVRLVVLDSRCDCILTLS